MPNSVIFFRSNPQFFLDKSPSSKHVQASKGVWEVRGPLAEGLRSIFWKGLIYIYVENAVFPPKKNWVLRYIHVYIYYHILYIEIIFLHNYIYICVCVDVYIYNIYIYIYTTQTQPTRHIDSNRLYTYAKNYAYLNIILCNYVYI
jgi:hypothetical protein